MFKLNDPTPPSKGELALWGMVWLVATVGGPVAVFLLLWVHPTAAKWSGVSAIVLHLGSSRMIVGLDALRPGRGDSRRLFNWLIFGGWALMVIVFFAGCSSIISRHL